MIGNNYSLSIIAPKSSLTSYNSITLYNPKALEMSETVSTKDHYKSKY